MKRLIRKYYTTHKNFACNIFSVLICCGFLLVVTPVTAQISFEILQQEMPTEPRVILMNISSRTCTYCLMQTKRIEKDLPLKKRLNDEVYYLSWTMEYENEFQFNGETFDSGSDFVERYGKDEHGNLAFPIWLIFDKNDHVVYRSFGLLTTDSVDELLNVLNEAERSAEQK